MMSLVYSLPTLVFGEKVMSLSIRAVQAVYGPIPCRIKSHRVLHERPTPFHVTHVDCLWTKLTATTCCNSYCFFFNSFAFDVNEMNGWNLFYSLIRRLQIYSIVCIKAQSVSRLASSSSSSRPVTLIGLFISEIH